MRSMRDALNAKPVKGQGDKRGGGDSSSNGSPQARCRAIYRTLYGRLFESGLPNSDGQSGKGSYNVKYGTKHQKTFDERFGKDGGKLDKATLAKHMDETRRDVHTIQAGTFDLAQFSGWLAAYNGSGARDTALEVEQVEPRAPSRQHIVSAILGPLQRRLTVCASFRAQRAEVQKKVDF